MPVYTIKKIAQANGQTDFQSVSLMMPLEYKRGYITNGEYREKTYAVADLRSYSEAEHRHAETMLTLILQQKMPIQAIEDSTISSSLPPQQLLAYHKFMEMRTDVPVIIEYRSEFAFFQNENIVESKPIADMFKKIENWLAKDPQIAFFFKRYTVLHEIKQDMLAESSAFMLANLVAKKDSYIVEKAAEQPTPTVAQSLDDYLVRRQQMQKEQTQKYFNTPKDTFVGKDGNHYPPLWIKSNLSDKVFQEIKWWHLDLLGLQGSCDFTAAIAKEKITEQHFKLVDDLFDTKEEKEAHKSETLKLWQAQEEMWQIHSDIMKYCEKKKGDALLYTYSLPNLVKQKTNCSKEVQQLVKEFGISLLNKKDKEPKESLHNFIFKILQADFFEQIEQNNWLDNLAVLDEEEKILVNNLNHCENG